MAINDPRTMRSPAGTWTGAEAAAVDVGLRRYMLNVYNYMASGLLLSGVVALLVSNTGLASVFFNIVDGRVVGYNALGWVAILAPIGLIFWMSAAAHRAQIGTLKAIYWAFVATMGIGLSVIMLTYTGVSVARVFFITAIAYGGLSLYGYTTKKDLSGMGTFLLMGLIGIIVASLVNIFLASTMLHFIVSVVGVLVFAGLTAYDTQRIKNTYFEVGGGELAERASIMGAVALYLNFINLFQFLMMFLGDRR
jgi:FtsH-binding integral membrane protein